MKKVFSTNRCIVGELNLKHRAGYIALHTNPNVMDPIPAEVMTREEANASLEDQIVNYQDPKPKLHVWAIEDASKETFVGTCAIVYKSADEVEIGFRILEAHWQQKYATEICKELIQFAFDSTAAKRVTAEVSSTNWKSIRVLEHHLDYKGKRANRELDTMDLQYAILRQQWALKG